MKHTCIEKFGKVFIEVHNDIETDKTYLVYNNAYFQEATEYFSELGIPCNYACVVGRENPTLLLAIKDSVTVETLYNISKDIKISLSYDEEGRECITLSMKL